MEIVSLYSYCVTVSGEICLILLCTTISFPFPAESGVVAPPQMGAALSHCNNRPILAPPTDTFYSWIIANQNGQSPPLSVRPIIQSQSHREIPKLEKLQQKPNLYRSQSHRTRVRGRALTRGTGVVNQVLIGQLMRFLIEP